MTITRINRPAPAMAMTVAGVLAFPALAGPEEHFDVHILIDVENNRLVTGSITEGEPGTPIEPEWRVFGAEFGEDPMFPLLATEPGFQLDDNSVTPGTPFKFIVPGPLQKWNGTGLEDTTAVMTLAFEGGTTTTGTSWVDGFEFASDGDGGLHDHFFLSIAGPGASDPADGVYLLPLQIAGKAGSFGGTDVFWFVMNLNMPEPSHDAAIEWVETHLASPPCPSDIDANREIDFQDLIRLLSDWGPCPE